MPYASQRDRQVQPLEMAGADWPAAPLNAFLASGGRPGTFDVWWDDPAQLAHNSKFALVGVNLYRSFDSEYGPYELLTDLPLGSNFWRDQTDNTLALDEDVSDAFLIRGAASAGQEVERYVFRVQHWPIVKEASQSIPANDPRDVQVFVDGAPARVLRIYGPTGEIELDARSRPDVATQKLIEAVLPKTNSRVTCTYRYTRSIVKTDLVQRVFYRVTSVGSAAGSFHCAHAAPVMETPLENAAAVSSYEIEKLDYMWAEAIRRNNWILQEGGERVKVFLRKQVGAICPCTPPTEHARQPVSDCLICYGTGIVGGYEGPYNVLLAPDDAEKRIAQKETGRTVEHTYEVWTGPTPLLSMRDFIVKANGERYSLGAVRVPSNRGMVLQQHFNIGHFDEKDIRYKVPLMDPTRHAVSQLRKVGPERPDGAITTEKPNIPDERELKGRTGTWENIEY
jgi:hypothetical protein